MYQYSGLTLEERLDGEWVLHGVTECKGTQLRRVGWGVRSQGRFSYYLHN
jgi:hypothetical protein